MTSQPRSPIKRPRALSISSPQAVVNHLPHKDFNAHRRKSSADNRSIFEASPESTPEPETTCKDSVSSRISKVFSQRALGNKTLAFYVLKWGCIRPLQAICVVSPLYVLAYACGVQHNTYLFLYGLLETCFLLYYLWLSRKCQQRVDRTPREHEDNLAQVRRLFLQILMTGLSLAPSPGLQTEHEPQTSGKSTLYNLSQTTSLKRRARAPSELNTGHVDLESERELSLVPALDRDDHRAIDFREKLRTWFSGAQWDDIQQENLFEWLSWSLLDKAYDVSLDLDQQKELDKQDKLYLRAALSAVQRRTGVSQRPGRNTQLVCLRLTIDYVNISIRPFLYYIAIAIAHYAARQWFMLYHGFEAYTTNRVEYLVRRPHGVRSPQGSPRLGDLHLDSDKCPIVFYHGLGIGLPGYTPWLRRLLNHLGDRPIVIPLQPHISMSFFHPRALKPLTRSEVVHGLDNVLTTLFAGRQAVIFSHSFGTISHTWILKDAPHLIHRNCFIDPVVLSLWEADVCFNFMYREPKTWMQLVMSYFVAQELVTAYAIRRHFNWSANSLLANHIPRQWIPHKIKFFLAGRDEILDAPRAKRYLESCDMGETVSYNPDFHHGEWTIDVLGGTGPTAVLNWLDNENPGDFTNGSLEPRENRFQ